MSAARQGLPANVQAAADAVRSLESQILDASRSGAIEGVVLRYGLFYGPDVASTVEMMATAKRRLLPAIRGDRRAGGRRFRRFIRGCRRRRGPRPDMTEVDLFQANRPALFAVASRMLTSALAADVGFWSAGGAKVLAARQLAG